MADKTGNDYEKGRRDALLSILSETTKRIEKKLDDNLAWQREVDRSLASGNERFAHIEVTCVEIKDEQRNLRNRDRNSNILTITLTSIATALGITIGK